MAMRTFRDRVRHAVLFELVGLAIVIPGSAYLFDRPAFDMGVVGVGAATIATVWNFFYNLGFDHVMQRVTGHTAKSIQVRIVHTVLFEASLLAILLPPISWYLGMTLWHTFLMDMSFVGFYLVYTFVYNAAYDRIFPIPRLMPAAAQPA
ncbi:PACE efflux transporter [Mesorhizobium sp. SP-1A]|uniref:PACE efflux transporter n=1 Tax=Mesorhizobium sp. SP-1A TaxID=3077840 RepID=UPI0028F6C7C5|nr:PACE efflux transporter [Mesorhizobium sp. SP-1A]